MKFISLSWAILKLAFVLLLLKVYYKCVLNEIRGECHH